MSVPVKISRVSYLVALALLLSVAAIAQTVSLSAMRDEQIWGHLRAGTWMLEQKAWPHTGLFSQAVERPWRDFTWGYDFLSALGYRLLGLRVLPALLMSFHLILAGITFTLAGGLRGRFWTAVSVSVVAQYILGVMGPSPACASVVLFGIELLLLLQSRRTGNLRMLHAFPVLFVLWANLDLGFVYGIALYALFVLGAWAASTKWFESGSAQFPATKLALIGAGCILGSIVTPYGYRGYGAFFAEQLSTVNAYLTAYKGMSFHRPQDYLLMLLAMTGFMALGIRRSRDFFLLATLIGASALAFHSQRASWLVVLVSVGVIGDTTAPRKLEATGTAQFQAKWLAFSACIAAVAISFAFLRIPRAQNELLAKAADEYPVAASDYICRQHLSPPMFNSYRWGGFLTWYLPQYPVAIDGRRGLYSEEQESDYFKAMNVEVPYQNLEIMARARTLLMDKSEVLADALREVSGFHVAYEDRIAVVLTKEPKE